MPNNWILVVDDDALIRETIAEILELEGYAVVTAAHGAQALDLIEQNQPSLILLDLRMPVLDGWGLVAELKRRRLALPLLIITAETSARTWAAEAGAVGYLAKPFELEALVETVAAIYPVGCARSAGPDGFGYDRVATAMVAT